MKKCTSCKLLKSFDSFVKNKSHKDGLHTQCKLCNKAHRAKRAKLNIEYHRKYRLVNQLELSEKRRAKRKQIPEKFLWQEAKKRAKQKGLEFNIEIEDIKIPKLCSYLNIPLWVSDENPSDNSPSIDRIDPSKGYIPGNICVCSFRANTIKRDASLHEIEQLYKSLKRITSNKQ